MPGLLGGGGGEYGGEIGVWRGRRGGGGGKGGVNWVGIYIGKKKRNDRRQRSNILDNSQSYILNRL